MPGRDGTGPIGLGARTGRGLGVCTGVFYAGGGRGLGYNCRRAGILGNYNNAVSKDALEEEKAILEARLDTISKQLERQ